MPKNAFGEEISEVIHDKCIGCQRCVAECPVNAITVNDDGTVKIDPEACIGCGRCFKVCPAKAILFEPGLAKPAPVAAQPPAMASSPAAAPVLQGGVAVFIETRDGAGAEVSWELVGKARELAQKLGSRVLGFLPGNGVQPVAADAIAYGCDVVYVVDHPILKTYLSKSYGKAMVTMAEQVKPEVLLLGATPLGRDLASVIATQLQTGLTADCTGLDVDIQEHLLLMTRPAFGGSIMCTVLCKDRRPQMSTVRPKVMKMPEKDVARRGEIKTLGFDPPSGPLPTVIEFIARAGELGDIDITKAKVLVVVGKGACSAKDLPMFNELAALLGGAVACSRPVVEAGLLPYMRQVGQTGKTVAPKLYIGVAVSGAVQHLVGMQGSEKVVAINTDPNAPLAQMADYALIGDYQQIVPELLKGIRARKPEMALK